MKLFTTLIRNTLAFLCLGILLAASNTVGQQKTLKELIVGTWLLDSVYDQYQDDKNGRHVGRRALQSISRAPSHYPLETGTLQGSKRLAVRRPVPN